MKETYTPGYSEAAAAFMVRRRLDPNGAFFLPYLKPGTAVLDCGCGPGTITRDIAQRVAPGRVIGLDFNAEQVAVASRDAGSRGIANLEFKQGSVYELPFADASFDTVFSHALLEHLREPAKAVAEFRRVLKRGGALGVCTPDWGGFLVAPPSEELLLAFEALAWLANSRAKHGLGALHAGQFVLLGSVVETKWLNPGDRARIEIESLGEVQLTVDP